MPVQLKYNIRNVDDLQNSSGGSCRMVALKLKLKCYNLKQYVDSDGPTALERKCDNVKQ